MKKRIIFLLTTLLTCTTMTFGQATVTKPTLPNKTTNTQQTQVSKATGTINGHGYVDLGLSVKWATCNIGASSSSDYGNYYAWGETETKSVYLNDTYKLKEDIKEIMSDITGDSMYDAARANWGNTWRVPTNNEIEELIKNCKWTWTTVGGHKGYKVTGSNGNSIFLPAAGYIYDSSHKGQGSCGLYWSSTPDDGYNNVNVMYLELRSYVYDTYSYWGYSGYSIRPVTN